MTPTRKRMGTLKRLAISFAASAAIIAGGFSCDRPRDKGRMQDNISNRQLTKKLSSMKPDPDGYGKRVSKEDSLRFDRSLPRPKRYAGTIKRLRKKLLKQNRRAKRLTGTALEESLRRKRDLVKRSRDLLKAGRFSLGEFILTTNLYDKREYSLSFNIRKAKRWYSGLLREVKRELRKGRSAKDAVRRVLSRKKYAYSSLASGFMGDIRGSKVLNCQSASHLIAALLYDSGKKDVYFRSYSPNSFGESHLAPVFEEGGTEYDILTGKPAKRKGVKIRAVKLLDLYASIKRTSSGGSGFMASRSLRHVSVLSFVYPHNGEIYSEERSSEYAPDIFSVNMRVMLCPPSRLVIGAKRIIRRAIRAKTDYFWANGVDRTKNTRVVTTLRVDEGGNITDVSVIAGVKPFNASALGLDHLRKRMSVTPMGVECAIRAITTIRAAD